MKNDEKQSFMQSLYSAFPLFPVVKSNKMFPRHIYRDLEREEIVNKIGGIRWDAIPNSIVKEEYAALYFFLPDAFVYYLPAYLRLILLDITFSDMVPETLVSCLSICNNNNCKVESSLSETRLNWLDKDQCKLVLQILLYIRTFWNDTEDFFGINKVIHLTQTRIEENTL